MSNQKKNRSFFAQFSKDIGENELREPKFLTVLKLVWRSISSFFVERPGQIIGSAFILIMFWGFHGELELLKLIWPDWRGPGKDLASRPDLIPGIPWDHELISFLGGMILLVMIPILIIKLGFKQPISNYGLGLPPKGRRALAGITFLLLTVISLPAFWIGAHSASMREVYPLYNSFSNWGAFVLYELTYLPFFIVIEFIFRGYLLFGLAGVRDDEIKLGGGGFPGVFYFHKYALLIQMLSYTAWHLGKPIPELWGTIFWGLFAGATAFAIRSLWPIIISHWLLNVFMDAIIWINVYKIN
ncbi:MAG: CPBP family intramembrane glutamic endopeptidase [bacterium]